jgi:hypothetical protein
MLEIYRLFYSPNNYQTLWQPEYSNIPYTEHQTYKVGWGKPIKDIWYKQNVEYTVRGRRESEVSKTSKIGDILGFSSMWCFGNRAIEYLGEEFLYKNGELLPVNCVDDNETYYVFNCLKQFDILDLDKSELIPSKVDILKIVLKEDINEDEIYKTGIFKIKLNNYHSTLYVTDYFIDKVKRSKLKGFRFKKLTE